MQLLFFLTDMLQKPFTLLSDYLRQKYGGVCKKLALMRVSPAPIAMEAPVSVGAPIATTALLIRPIVRLGNPSGNR